MRAIANYPRSMIGTMSTGAHSIQRCLNQETHDSVKNLVLRVNPLEGRFSDRYLQVASNVMKRAIILGQEKRPTSEGRETWIRALFVLPQKVALYGPPLGGVWGVLPPGGPRSGGSSVWMLLSSFFSSFPLSPPFPTPFLSKSRTGDGLHLGSILEMNSDCVLIVNDWDPIK